MVARPFMSRDRTAAETDGQQVDPRAYFYDLNVKANGAPASATGST